MDYPLCQQVNTDWTKKRVRHLMVEIIHETMLFSRYYSRRVLLFGMVYCPGISFSQDCRHGGAARISFSQDCN
jgi:hypothetical protein